MTNAVVITEPDADEVLVRQPLSTNSRVVAGRPLCRHCQQKYAIRPRGLCWSCFYTPGVRDLYPPTSKFARQGVAADYNRNRLPAEPTGALPGTPRKVAVMEERALAGCALFHPLDANRLADVPDWCCDELLADDGEGHERKERTQPDAPGPHAEKATGAEVAAAIVAALQRMRHPLTLLALHHSLRFDGWRHEVRVQSLRCSADTVDAALDQLEDEGLIAYIVGTGFVIAEEPAVRPVRLQPSERTVSDIAESGGERSVIRRSKQRCGPRRISPLRGPREPNRVPTTCIVHPLVE
jgi:hypothetical protein